MNLPEGVPRLAHLVGVLRVITQPLIRTLAFRVASWVRAVRVHVLCNARILGVTSTTSASDRSSSAEFASHRWKSFSFALSL